MKGSPKGPPSVPPGRASWRHEHGSSPTETRASRHGQGASLGRVRGLARALAALLLVATALLPAPALAQGNDVQLQDQAFEIARKLRCPVCVSESVADSNAQIAQEMRELIQDDLQRGMTEPEIMAYFQGRYGDWILLDPPKRGLHLVVWLLPIVAAIGGIVFLSFKIRRWRAAADAPVLVDPDDVERVRDAMRSEV